MKRTFKKSELDGVTGYQGNNGGSMLWIPAFKYAVDKSGYETKESQCSESCCIRDGDTPITGEPLVAALRERGVEVIDDMADANAKTEVDEWGMWDGDVFGYDPVYHRIGESVVVYYSDGRTMHSHHQWSDYEHAIQVWRPLTPAEVETFKAKIASHAKPEVKPTEAEQLRKELDEANGTINRLRDSLTKAENDRQQPPMSDERFLQEASIAAMQGMMASGDEVAFPLTGEGSENIGAWAVDYAELILKALKARKEGQ